MGWTVFARKYREGQRVCEPFKEPLKKPVRHFLRFFCFNSLFEKKNDEAEILFDRKNIKRLLKGCIKNKIVYWVLALPLAPPLLSPWRLRFRHTFAEKHIV